MDASTIIWLVILFFLLGGGTVIKEILDGRRKVGRLKAENKSLRQQLEELQEKAAETPSDRLVEQARVALERQVQMRDALIRVQVTDDAVPQLPQQVRNLVDAALEESSGKTVNLVNPKGRKGAKA